MIAGGDGEARGAGAVWGMLMADASCLASRRGGDATPRGEHDQAGKAAATLSALGEGGLILLEALAEADGDAEAYEHRLSAAHQPITMRAGADVAAPVVRGPDVAAEVAIAGLAPLVVRFAGDPRLMSHVDAYTRVLQDSDRAVAYACAHARLLATLLRGASLDKALDGLLGVLERRTEIGHEIGAGVDAARAARGEPVPAVAEGLGLSDRLQDAFPAALQAALASEHDLPAALAACSASGDDSGRAMLVGSWLGARGGLPAVPPAWRERLVDGARIAAGLAGLAGRRRAAAPLRAH